MSKYIKGLVQGEFEKKLSGVTGFMVVNTMGMDGVNNNKLRTDLGKKNIKVLVVKNTLARRAFETAGMKGVGAVLSGPCTIAYGADSVVDVAKEIVEIIKTYKKLEIKGAYLDGVSLDAKGAVALSKMPNRRQLQGQIVTMLLSPGARVAGAIMSPARNIAGCVKAVIEKAEKAA